MKYHERYPDMPKPDWRDRLLMWQAIGVVIIGTLPVWVPIFV